MDCMDPVIPEMPKGRWHCPQCPPLPEEQFLDAPPNIYDAQQPDMPIREPSVASSSRLSAQLDGMYKGKGKAPVVVSSDDSDSEEDMDVDIMSTTPRTRPKSRKKTKSRSVKMFAILSDGPVESLGLSRRARIRIPSPTLPKVRLRLPAQKGKRREREEDDAPKGMFDDILSLDDRDVSKTSIRESDKQLYDRSRLLAEVKLKHSTVATLA
jgi:hypothetical protein